MKNFQTLRNDILRKNIENEPKNATLRNIEFFIDRELEISVTFDKYPSSFQYVVQTYWDLSVKVAVQSLLDQYIENGFNIKVKFSLKDDYYEPVPYLKFNLLSVTD